MDCEQELSSLRETRELFEVCADPDTSSHILDLLLQTRWKCVRIIRHSNCELANMVQAFNDLELIGERDNLDDPCKTSELPSVYQSQSIKLSFSNFLIFACYLLCLLLYILCPLLYDKKHCLNAIAKHSRSKVITSVWAARHNYTPNKTIPVKFDRRQKLLKHLVNRKIAVLVINSKHGVKTKTKEFRSQSVPRVKHTHGDGSVQCQPCQDLDDDDSSGQPRIVVAQQHDSDEKYYVESVMVNDQPSKDKKVARGKFDRHTPPSLRSYRYSPAVDAILFRNYQIVRASTINAQELYHVYEVPMSELKAKCVQETHRLLTYDGQFNSQHMTAISLARAGLINLKRNNDTVVCVWCLVQFRNFKQAIDVSALHFAYSEHLCEFIKHYARLNLPIAKSQGSDQPEAFLSLTSNAQDSDTRFDNPSQNTTMSAAGTMLTIAPGERTSEEDGQASVSQSTITDGYIQFEKRTEALAILGTHNQNMRYEKCRLFSFIREGWTTHFAEQLATAGFYLTVETNGTLSVACPFCDGKIPNIQKDTIPQFTTEKDHSPLQVHILKFPACAFIQGNNLGARGNVPMINGEFRWNQSQVVTSAQANSRSDLVTIGIATTHADCPAMAVYERRIESFLTLPYDHPKGAEELATCGFYNTGIEGQTKCFWCGVDCGSWSSAEDVWVRHARSMRTCQFVVNEKGLDFVNGVIDEHGARIDNHRDEDRIHNVTTRMIRPRMDSLVVQAVIGMGYSRDHVKTAIINRLKKLKPDYTMTADLVKDVLALRHKEMTYQRDLKLPDVPVMPKAESPENDDPMTNSDEQLNGSINTAEEGNEREVVAMAEDRLSSHQPETPEETSEPQTKGVLDLSVAERLSLSAQMMSQLTCKICISSAVGIIFLPCAHLVCCTACAAAMTECPMCRRNIVGTIKANV